MVSSPLFLFSGNLKLFSDSGELCYLNQQCEFRLGLFSECKNGQCACKDGSHYVVNENACFKSSSELRRLKNWFDNKKSFGNVRRGWLDEMI
jgi:hypothetical protein